MTVSTVDLTRSHAQDLTALAFAGHPSYFISETLLSEDESLYPKQEEMGRSLVANPRTAVVGCNSSGKDYTTARLVLWWMETHSPAKALVYGPTTRQVNDIVFSEMRSAYRFRPRIDGYSYKGVMYETSAGGYRIEGENRAIGFATRNSTGSTEYFNLQGFHSPNLLVVITEAHAITQAEYDAVIRLHPTRVIMTGNAFVQSGPFYDAFYDKADAWYQIRIDAWDTPNLQGGDVPGMVTQSDIDEAEREWGVNSPLYQGSIQAIFPDNLEDMLVPLHDAQAAADRSAIADAVGQPRVAALDVAGPGQDLTVLLFRQGPLARYLWQGHEPDTMATARRSLDICLAERVQYLVVDDAGIGGLVTERMRLLQKEEPIYRDIIVVAFNGGSKPKNPRKFSNANDEIYWRTRLWLSQPDSSIPNDRKLIGQLTARKYETDPKGRIVIESKRVMRKRGLKSPDEADALAMTMAVQVMSGNQDFGAEKAESLWR